MLGEDLSEFFRKFAQTSPAILCLLLTGCGIAPPVGQAVLAVSILLSVLAHRHRANAYASAHHPTLPTHLLRGNRKWNLQSFPDRSLRHKKPVPALLLYCGRGNILSSDRTADLSPWYKQQRFLNRFAVRKPVLFPAKPVSLALPALERKKSQTYAVNLQLLCQHIPSGSSNGTDTTVLIRHFL